MQAAFEQNSKQPALLQWIKFRLGQGDNDRRVHLVHKGVGNAVLI
ncbi:hypothetical protein HMPREF0476_2073 [Kingella kingae ATCC 23330]|uniref:Uncharacterized protein n=1 Tax=Kingella kingae ATCC 23330 TaxID=887327 RepID=F5SA40_KINKI|nr:hypothetical protein HMPREF0476_2073 [Kingella kingae ATCC 23330]